MDTDFINQCKKFLCDGDFSQVSEIQLSCLIGLGMILALRLDRSKPSIQTLEQAAIHPALPDFENAAVLQLQELSTEGQVEATLALYRLAVVFQNEESVRYLLEKKVPAVDSGLVSVFRLLYSNSEEVLFFDPGLRILTAEFLTQPDDLMATRIISAAQRKGLDHWAISAAAARLPVSIPAQQKLLQSFGRFDEADRRRTVELLTSSAPGQSEIQDTLCQLFLRYDDQSARDVTLSKNYLPLQVHSRAMFLFLTNQWEQYELLDFDGSLLTAAYETASPELRKRLLDFSRNSGRTDWVTRLSASTRLRWLNDLGDDDWRASIRSLADQKRYSDLWLLAQSAPPIWAAEMIILLDHQGFIPSGTEEAFAFSNLAGLAQKASAVSTIPPDYDLLVLPSKNSTCLALSKDGKTLASGTTGATLYLFSLSFSPSSLQTISVPVPHTRTLLFSATDQYLVTAGSDNQIRIVRPTDGKVVKTIAGHSAMIRSLALSPDDRTLFSAGFDGDIRSYRFPEGVFAGRIGRTDNEIFCAVLSPQGDYMLTAGADHLVSVWPLPSAGQPVHRLSGHSDSILALTVSQQGQLAVSASRDHQVRVWNYVSGREVFATSISERLPTCVVIHPNMHEMIVGGYDGSITFFSLSNGEMYHQLPPTGSPINTLLITADSQTLICAHNNGEIRLFDLSIHLILQNPLGNASPAEINHIEAKKKQFSHSAISKWLTFTIELLRYRQRYEIMIDRRHPVVNIGEFDIQL